jgi:glutamyl/glutaminyl-tRNA synthetase
LRWLGLEWDAGPAKDDGRGPYFQSRRQEIYRKHLIALVSGDRAYTDDEGAVRFRVPEADIVIEDKICGTQTVNLVEQGSKRWDTEAKQNVAANPDLVIGRADGTFLFHFVNVVDDIEMDVSHVIRGEDHLANTPKHAALFDALGYARPEFAHIPLILNKDGSKMSKRDEGASVDGYIRQAFSSDAVRNYLCLLGWSPKDDREKMEIEEVVALFDYDHLNRSNAKFDMEKCLWLNSQYLVEKPADDFVATAKTWMAANHCDPGVPDSEVEAALRVMQPKIKHVPEVKQHFPKFFDSLPIEPAAKEMVAKNADARAHLECIQKHVSGVSSWDEDAISAALNAAAMEIGIKKGKFMFALRVVSTGASQGTDLLPTLVVIGKERLLKRFHQRLPEIFG